MIRVMNIASGNQGTRETLRLMVALTLEAVRDETFHKWAAVLFDFPTAREIDAEVRRSYTYVDEEIETLYSPMFNMHRLLQNQDIVGDCDDVAMFLAAVLKIKNYRTRFVALRTRRHDPEFYHVVTEAMEQGQWKRFDPTVVPGLIQVDYGQMIEYL